MIGNRSITAEEIESHKTPAGGWTRDTLAQWGVPWPPPKNWKKALIAFGCPLTEPGTVTVAAFSSDDPESFYSETLRNHRFQGTILEDQSASG